MFANCHNHSTFSDGVYSPEKLVELAKELGHKAIILTDHDTVRGTYFLQKAARKAGMLSLLGCEFSTFGFDGENFHLLGFDFNPDNNIMKKLLARTSAKQTERSHLLFDRGLERGTLRPGVTWQEVLDFYPDNDYFCNNQIFDTMVAKGIYKWEEYDEFVFGNFRPDKETDLQIEDITNLHTPDIEEVIYTIKKSGGVPIIAHPQNQFRYAEELAKMGIMGFETLHPMLLESNETELWDNFCTEKNLYKMGGTDHSSVLGGYAGRLPGHDIPPDSGYVSEENFMKLYRRELG